MARKRAKAVHVAEVVRIREGDPAIVAEFEALLARAKSGEVVAFACAVQTTDNGTGGCFAIGRAGDTAHLGWAIERVKHRLLNRDG